MNACDRQERDAQMTTQFKYFPEIESAFNIPSVCTADDLTEATEVQQYREECKRIADAFKLLSSYAEARGHAVECRLKGNIELAQRFESAAESVYAQLPDFAKW